MFLKPLLGISGLSLLACCAMTMPVRSQSFSVDTTVSQSANLYSYTFTLNYDQAGVNLGLIDPIYDWSFYLDPTLDAPAQVFLPTGWKDTYDSASGQFDFYTEGPSGFGNGDFGVYVIQPGQSLSGFGLTTAAAPDLSIAFATDEQFNQDAETATLPTTLPLAVPEFGTGRTLTILLLLGCLITRFRPGCLAKTRFLPKLNGSSAEGST